MDPLGREPSGADKAKIQEFVMEEYGVALKRLESQYEENHLDDARRTIDAEREGKATLIGVLTMMANSQGPKFDMRGSNFAGGFAETVQGDQLGPQHKDAAENQSLIKAATEIQALLKKLEQTAPAKSISEKMVLASRAIAQIESKPTLKQRAIAALTAGGIKAFEAAIDHPVAAFVVGAIEEWKES